MPSALKLRVPNQIEELTGIIDALEDYLSAMGIGAGPIARLSLITDELFNNTVSYGFPEGGDHEICLEVSVGPENISFIITDDGLPFNPLEKEPPDTSAGLDERSIGGLGLHLVRNIASQVSYQRQEGHNILTVTLPVS